MNEYLIFPPPRGPSPTRARGFARIARMARRMGNPGAVENAAMASYEMRRREQAADAVASRLAELYPRGRG